MVSLGIYLKVLNYLNPIKKYRFLFFTTLQVGILIGRCQKIFDTLWMKVVIESAFYLHDALRVRVTSQIVSSHKLIITL